MTKHGLRVGDGVLLLLTDAFVIQVVPGYYGPFMAWNVSLYVNKIERRKSISLFMLFSLLCMKLTLFFVFFEKRLLRHSVLRGC